MQNSILTNALAYATMRAELRNGAEGTLRRAQYHAERGEHSKAKPMLEKAKEHGPEHATKALVIEASMTETSKTQVTAAEKDENIVTEQDAADGITWYYDSVFLALSIPRPSTSMWATRRAGHLGCACTPSTPVITGYL